MTVRRTVAKALYEDYVSRVASADHPNFDHASAKDQEFAFQQADAAMEAYHRVSPCWPLAFAMLMIGMACGMAGTVAAFFW